MLNPVSVQAEFPEHFEFLFHPARYKVLYGGRDGGKSWGVADALLLLAAQKKLRILCTRELQNSIKDSVHKLLSDRIAALGLVSAYEITLTSIKCLTTDSEFIFEGLRLNADKIKSFEAIDIAWTEEAHKISYESWKTLVPTIRKDGSEIWVTFNPELESDETYQRFIVHTPKNAIIRKVNWYDNPWHSAALEEDRVQLKEQDPDEYLHVWEGHCRQTLKGAVYAQELRDAATSERIRNVPYDATKPVHTFWDLGWRDAAAIWFAQVVGFEYRIIDFYSTNQRTINHFLQVMQAKGYTYGTDYLPHDAGSTSMAAGGRTIEGLMRAAGRKVQVLERTSVAVGINAARTILPNCYFDEKKCADGLQCLRRYRYEFDDENNTFSKVPVHDEYSHGADAFRYLAMGLTDKREKKLNFQTTKRVELPIEGNGWMG